MDLESSESHIKNIARRRVKTAIICYVCSIVIAISGIARAEQSFTPAGGLSSEQVIYEQSANDKTQKSSAGERLWSGLKDISIGPFKLDLGGGLRLRGEFQDNFNIKKFGGASRDEFFLERARLELRARFPNYFQFFLQGQDSRELGCGLSNEDFPNGSPYNNNFDLRQAFLEWFRIGGSPVGFKVGRQSIAFADNRLMGPGEWGNVGRYVWDAAVLTWRSEIVDMDLFYALRLQYDPTEFDYSHFDYKVLGVFSTFPVKTLKFHAFYFLKNSDSQSDSPRSVPSSFQRHSPGVSLEGYFDGGIDIGMGLIPQFGGRGDNSIIALGAYAVFGYSFPLHWSPRIGLHYAYGSGDSDPDDNTHRTFDGLFGAVDKYYGRMNQFAWMNLHDLQLAFSANPLNNIKISVDYHLFMLADKHDAWYYSNGKAQGHDPDGTSGAALGHEFDFGVSVKATKSLRFQVGYGIFVPGEFVRDTASRKTARWGFAQGSYDF